MNNSRQLLLLIVLSTLLLPGCGHSGSTPAQEMPKKMIWAWERPEDLEHVDESIGVAYLAQTLILESNSVVNKRRRQPLKVNPRTFLVAVTRIETNRDSKHKPVLSENQKAQIVRFVDETAGARGVRGIQIDFDATKSERKFYKGLLADLRQKIGEDFPLSITALASWCMEDRWLADVDVEEAVPMLFDLGTDKKMVERFLSEGTDWQESRCRGSYGMAVYEDTDYSLIPGRRVYYFNKRSWTPADTAGLF